MELVFHQWKALATGAAAAVTMLRQLYGATGIALPVLSLSNFPEVFSFLWSIRLFGKLNPGPSTITGNCRPPEQCAWPFGEMFF